MQLYGDLFVDVQMQPLFSGSKTFADATPRCLNLGALWPSGPARAARRCLKAAGLFARHFVAEPLELGALQSPAADEGSSVSLPLRAHIRRLWPHLLRCAAQRGARAAAWAAVCWGW